MKHLKHIILLLSIFALFGCKEKYCEGYFIYEVTGYTDTLLQHYTDKNGNEVRNFLSENEETSFDKLIIFFNAELEQIEVTNWCSYMKDSLIGYIDTIYITSDNLYNEEHPANNNLNDLFNLLHPKDNGMQSDLITINEYIRKKDKIRRSYRFLLTVPPDSVSTHSFIITIKKTNGKEYKVTTIPVKITP